jgi:hypothetical protein
MPSPRARTPSWQLWGAYGLLFLTFVTITYDHAKAWNNPNRGDQDLDLILGLKIRNLEALSDGYHHPLLPALIAPFAEKDLVYFAKAKLVNVVIGAVAFWVVAYVGLRMVGPLPTFLALAALAPGLSNKSAELTAEPLLLLFLVLTFYYLVSGFEQPRAWALAGACAALAYLTKGSGLLLVLAYVLAVLKSAPKLTLTARFWLFPLAFGLVASPLLAYNWQAFGSPLFNYNTAHVIWLDYTEEQMIMFDNAPPTMSSYLATHSSGQILARWLRGLVRVRGAEWVIPFLVLFVFVPKQWLAYFAEAPAKRLTVSVASTLVLTFYLPFAWSSSIQRGIRYLFPIFPIMFLLLSDLVVFYAVRFIRWRWPRWTGPSPTRWAVYGVLVTLTVVWLVQLSWRDFQPPLAIDFEDQATAEMYHLLDTPAFDGKQVLLGPSHEFTGSWLFRHNVSFPIIPPGLSGPAFIDWLGRAGIDYILANAEMIRRRQQSVGEYLAYSPDGGVQVLRVEPAWEIVARGPRPSRFVLIRVH